MFSDINSFDDIQFANANIESPGTGSGIVHITQEEVTKPTIMILHISTQRLLGFCLDSAERSSVVGQKQFDEFVKVTC